MKNDFRGKNHQIIWAASWKVRPRRIRSTFYVLIDRLFLRAQHLDNESPMYVYGAGHRQGRALIAADNESPMYAYGDNQSPVYVYGGYENGRPVMLVYLDKKNMVGKVEERRPFKKRDN